MRQATDSIVMHADLGNVSILPMRADTFVTRPMLSEAVQAATRLPPGWFHCRLIDEDDGVATLRLDHVHLAQVAGPPCIGDFSIHREPRGRFSVTALGNPDDLWGEPDEIGQSRTMGGAIDKINKFISAHLDAWGVALKPV